MKYTLSKIWKLETSQNTFSRTNVLREKGFGVKRRNVKRETHSREGMFKVTSPIL